MSIELRPWPPAHVFSQSEWEVWLHAAVSFGDTTSWHTPLFSAYMLALSPDQTFTGKSPQSLFVPKNI